MPAPSHNDKEDPEDAAAVVHHPRVYLRLRPLSELEVRRRGRCAVEVDSTETKDILAGHDTTTTTTVTLEDGTSVELDGVLVVDDSKEGCIHNHDSSILRDEEERIAQQLVQGHNCTVLAYGCTGTGKTTTLFGESSMLQHVTEQLFQELQHQSTSPVSQILVTCSVVEIYLERIRDLLLPLSGSIVTSAASNNHNRNPGSVVRLVTKTSLSQSNRPTVELQGAARLSCLGAADIVAVVQRALAFRTCASNAIHSTRSTVLVQVQMEQHQQEQVICSQFRFIDLVGSELVHTTTTTTGANGSSSAETASTSTDTLEAAQISVSLKALHQNLHAHQMNPHWPTVTRLVWSALHTSIHSLVVLTASPSHLSALDTAQTLQFGADCRRMRVTVPTTTTRDVMSLAEQSQLRKQNEQLQQLVQGLVRECSNLKPKQRSDNSQLWYMIDQITKQQQQQQPQNHNETLSFCCVDHDTARELQQLRHDQKRLIHNLESAAAERDQLCSDLAILQAQIDTLDKHLQHHKHRAEQILPREIHNLRRDLRQQQHQCRVSQYREHEAVTFVRQLRKFYARLLEKTARDGTGMALHVAGAPSLTDMVDLDRHLLESGLLERHDAMNGAAAFASSSSNKNQSAVTTTQPHPSSEALQASAQQCAKLQQAVAHEEKQAAAAQAHLEQPPPLATAVPIELCAAPENRVDDSSQHRVPVVDGNANLSPSIVRTGGRSLHFCDDEQPDHIEARQRLYQTPAGRFVELREHLLEQELRQLSEANTSLQRHLDEATVNVQALSATHGMAATQDKMRIAQEMRNWKEQLERKNNDLKTVIWKMNELHMVGKTLKAQSEQREQHVVYLEEKLAEVQVQSTGNLAEQQEVEERLRKEIVQLQQQIKNASTPIWHLLENSSDFSRTVPLSYRLVVPFTTNTKDWAEVVDDPDMSTGEPGEWTDLLETYQTAGRCNVGTQTDLGDSFYSAQGITEENISGLMFMDSPLHLGPRPTVKKIDEVILNAAMPVPLCLDEDDDGSNNAAQPVGSSDAAVELERFIFLDDSETGQKEDFHASLGLDNDLIPNNPVTSSNNPLHSYCFPEYVGEDNKTIGNDVPLYAVDSAASPTLSPISSLSVTAMSKATLAIMARTLNMQDLIEAPQQPKGVSSESSLKCEHTDTEQEGNSCHVSTRHDASQRHDEMKNRLVDTGADDESEITTAKSSPIHKDAKEVADAFISNIKTGSGTELSCQMPLASIANETKDYGPDAAIVHDEVTAVDDPCFVPAEAKCDVSAGGPSKAEAMSAITESTSSSKSGQKPAERAKSSFLERLQKQAQKKLDQDSSAGGGGGKPEFMKLFNTIASKNLNEKVVEASGAVAPREATIVSFEQLHLRKIGKGANPGDDNRFSQGHKKWTPRKAKKDDSDSDSDDSFARGFMRGAQMGRNGGQAKEPSTLNSDPASDLDEAKDSVHPAPAAQPVRRLTLDSDSESSSADEKPRDPASSAPTSAPQPEKSLAVDSDSNFSDNESTAAHSITFAHDSNSEDKSRATQPVLESPSVVTQPRKTESDVVQASPPEQTLDSDSESNSDDESKAFSVRPTVSATPKPQPERRSTLDSDSDSDDESKASPKVPTVSDSPKPQPGRRLTLDSDSDSDSDNESKFSPVRPTVSASSISHPVRSLTLDSDSDSNDKSKSSFARPISSPSPVLLPERQLTLDPYSDSNTNDDSQIESANPAAFLTTKLSKLDKNDGSDSDSCDSDDESKAPAKAAIVLSTQSPLVRNSSNTSWLSQTKESDSESSDEESEAAPPKQNVMPVSVAARADPTKTLSLDSESENSDSSGDESRSSKKAELTQQNESYFKNENKSGLESKFPAAANETQNDESLLEDDPKSSIKPTVMKQRETKSKDESSSSSSDEDNESSSSSAASSSSKEGSSDKTTSKASLNRPNRPDAANEAHNDESASEDDTKPSNPIANKQREIESSKDESSSSSSDEEEDSSSSSAASTSSEDESSEKRTPKTAPKCSKPEVLPKQSGSVAKKAKPLFVMKDGKLVKISSGVERPSKSATSGSTQKAKFAIQNGKLVSNDSTFKKTDHVRKDGKLIKNDSATSSAAPTKKKKPAFTIVDGKLVKANKDKPVSAKGKKK